MGWESDLCKHGTFISSGCMLLSRLSRMFSDFPCVLDSSSARTQTRYSKQLQEHCSARKHPAIFAYNSTETVYGDFSIPQE